MMPPDRIVIAPVKDKVVIQPVDPTKVSVVARGVRGERGAGIYGEGIVTFTASETAPENPAVGDLWLDIS
jgi:hypothetical protein